MMSVKRALHVTGLIALTALVGCTDANESLIVLQAQVPNSECVVADDGASSTRLESGILDVALDQLYSYKLFPLVQNNLIPAGGAMDIEPNRVSISGAQVKIVAPSGVVIPFRDDCSAEFDHPSHSSISPGDTRAIQVEAIRSCHAALFQDLFRTGALNPGLGESVYFRVIVRIKGRHGGTEILADPFEFPLRVCYGCLQTGFSGPYSLFNFPMTPSCGSLERNPFPGNLCGPAQDFGPILCCAQDALAEVIQCPGVPTGMAPAPEP
jgi:hypothetical protein